MRSNINIYGGETHQTDSQNSTATAHSGRELYHLQFSLQASSPETFGYTPVYEGRFQSSWTDLIYYYESELCGGEVTVSFSMFLPW
jgi:hypothetical protein